MLKLGTVARSSVAFAILADAAAAVAWLNGTSSQNVALAAMITGTATAAAAWITNAALPVQP